MFLNERLCNAHLFNGSSLFSVKETFLLAWPAVLTYFSNLTWICLLRYVYYDLSTIRFKLVGLKSYIMCKMFRKSLSLTKKMLVITEFY